MSVFNPHEQQLSQVKAVGRTVGKDVRVKVGVVDGLVVGALVGTTEIASHVLGGLPVKAVLSTCGEPAMTLHLREEQKAKADEPMEVTEVGM